MDEKREAVFKLRKGAGAFLVATRDSGLSSGD